MVREGLEWSGYDEVTLTSLSTADFSDIEDTVRTIVEDPPTRSRSRQPPEPAESTPSRWGRRQIQAGAAHRAHLPPRRGTWRMRQVINKLIREEDLYAAVDAAFSQGWRRVKLYFLIGLPTETDEDTLGIAEPRPTLCGDRATPTTAR